MLAHVAGLCLTGASKDEVRATLIENGIAEIARESRVSIARFCRFVELVARSQDWGQRVLGGGGGGFGDSVSGGNQKFVQANLRDKHMHLHKHSGCGSIGLTLLLHFLWHTSNGHTIPQIMSREFISHVLYDSIDRSCLLKFLTVLHQEYVPGRVIHKKFYE